MQLKKIFVIVGLLIVTSGCAQQPTKRSIAQSANEHYSAGMESIKQGDFVAAINAFKNQIKLHPDAPKTEKAMLQLVYIHYKQKQWNVLVDVVDEFIEKYPLSKKLDYAYYSKGLAFFNIGLEEKQINSKSQGDDIRQAYQSFSKLVNRFPESRYADDSTKRMAFLRGKLAMSEVSRARAALNSGEYDAAIVHAEYVIENYQGVPAAAEALGILTQSYNLLGLDNGERSVKLLAGKALDTSVIEPARTETGWRNRAWLYAQRSTDYTLQLLMSRNEQGIIDIIDRYHLFLSGNYAYYPVKREGVIWYALVYGAFSNLSMAETAIKSLPDGLGEDRPWIRQISKIQKIVEKGVY